MHANAAAAKALMYTIVHAVIIVTVMIKNVYVCLSKLYAWPERLCIHFECACM